MHWAYNVAIQIYTWLLALAAAFHHKAKLRRLGLQALKSTDNTSPFSSRPIWFHCASLGEFEQGRPVMERCKADFPNRPILLSFFSPSGFEVRKNYPGADRVVYLPPDLPAEVAGFLDRHNPIMAIFVKYEVWQNFFRTLARRDIPLYIVSAAFRPGQVYFKKWMPGSAWLLAGLAKAEIVFTQDATGAALLRGAGIDRVIVAGDTRFDRVAAVADAAERVPAVEGFLDGRRAIVAGSTWPPDEVLIAHFRSENPMGKLAWVIAPHEVDGHRVRSLCARMGKGCVLLSELEAAKVPVEADVLVVDRVGLLSALYRYATLTYVGGGFGAGIHNTLEPAVFGKPVIFGPRYRKFIEAVDLIELGAAFSVSDKREFATTVSRLLGDERSMERAGAKSRDYVMQHRGATDRIMSELDRCLSAS